MRRVSPMIESARRSSAAGAGVLAALLLCASLARADAPAEFRCQRDHVLGTSLDLIGTAGDAQQAKAVEEAVLKEVERLSGILNAYDPQSEIGRLNATTEPVKCSAELFEVLEACENWRKASDGAFNGQLGRVIETWKQAEKAGKLPDPADLAARVAEAGKPAFEIDKPHGTVRRLNGAKLDVGALAKGYIVDKALTAGQIEGCETMLLDIGGDVRAWSRKSGPDGKNWSVGVADPAHPADNAVPRARLLVQNAAVATSGNYARFYTIAGTKHSHIFDPRTGQSADRIVSSTAVAGDCATADALATIFSVLDPKDSLRLVKTVKGAECMIVAADGAVYTSDGWKKLEAPAAAPDSSRPSAKVVKGPEAWPDGYQTVFSLNLKRTWVRPYVAIWVEDASGKAVKTLAVWGREQKYLRQLASFWKQAGGDRQAVDAVSRASRSGGKYTLVWDGTDDAGKPVPQGKYVLRLELFRKEGKRFDLSGPVECGSKAVSGSIPDSPEVTDMEIRYEKQEK